MEGKWKRQQVVNSKAITKKYKYNKRIRINKMKEERMYCKYTWIKQKDISRGIGVVDNN